VKRLDPGGHEHPLLDVSEFDKVCGLEILEYTDELVRGRVPVVKALTQPLGMVHGGVYATIAEALASMGTNLGVFETGLVGLGQSNEMSFLRPANRGDLYGTARRRHRGESRWIWDVEIEDDQHRICAIGRVAVAVRPMPEGAPG
jgi:uncharacterized protein (TIGR00369 family)